jgi:hypothetical protein
MMLKSASVRMAANCAGDPAKGWYRTFRSHGKEMWALPLNQTPELILLINNLPMVNHCVASSEGKRIAERHSEQIRDVKK